MLNQEGLLAFFVINLEFSTVFEQVISSLTNTNSVKDVEKLLDDYGVDYDEEEQNDIEKAIDKSMQDVEVCAKDCENCEYKKYYLSHVRKMEEQDNKNEVKKEPSNKFYEEMKEQIVTLFENNPSEDYLMQLLPNSKWVKVNIDDNGDYYVLGLIYDDDKLKYICYGVPGVYQKYPPRELSGYPVWFPLDENNTEGFGYWLSYQDADSGESVKAVVI